MKPVLFPLGVALGILALALTAVVAGVFGWHVNSYVYRLTYLNKSEIGIVCSNGADPTGTKVGEMVVISCGKDGDQ
jgi:hypothetical protein